MVLKDIKKSYKIGKHQSNKALQTVSLALKRGQIFGLLGPNGSGKTTLINILTGILPPDHGDVWIAGNSIKSDSDKAYLYIGVCP